ncbi:hypothetical protein ABZ814_23530 [Micromonospora musae]|uniref:WXG100 family type VII secretion target n=1 Tax=Micromonospora musae TaxID=1894970 RepID=UPI0033D930D4
MTRPTGETYIGGGGGHLVMGIGELHVLATHTIVAKVDDLVHALDTVGKTLESLKLSWAGDAKKEAEALLARWTEVSDAIFGTKKHPEKGVLMRIAGGVENAAYAYNQSESAVQGSWRKLHDDLQTILAGGTPAAADGTDGSRGDGDLQPPIYEL